MSMADQNAGASGMTSIVPFQFEGHTVRTIEVGGEVWFIAKDVAGQLGYQDTDQAIRNHCKAAQSCPVEVTGQVRRLAIIPERDLYRLIMRSKLPTAEAFEEWVTGEVLPTIRRTGSYAAPAFAVPQTLSEALRLAADQAEQIEAHRAQLAVTQPKADALDRLEGMDGSMCITAAAKVLKVGPRELSRFLEQHRWTYRRPGGRAALGYQDKIASGLLEHKPTRLDRPDGPKIVEQVLVTVKGLTRLAQVMQPGERTA